MVVVDQSAASEAGGPSAQPAAGAWPSALVPVAPSELSLLRRPAGRRAALGVLPFCVRPYTVVYLYCDAGPAQAACLPLRSELDSEFPVEISLLNQGASRGTGKKKSRHPFINLGHACAICGLIDVAPDRRSPTSMRVSGVCENKCPLTPQLQQAVRCRAACRLHQPTCADSVQSQGLPTPRSMCMQTNSATPWCHVRHLFSTTSAAGSSCAG